MATYEIRAAHTQYDVLNGQCDVVDAMEGTLAEAKRRARYYLTNAYRRDTQMTEPLVYAQVLRNSECVADFFRD